MAFLCLTFKIKIFYIKASLLIIITIMKQLFIIFGAPGSGKGYFVGCLKDQLHNLGITDYLYISTGDLLREEIKAQTPLGKEIEQIVNSGKLVPDHIVSELVMKAIKQDNKVKILDGYPRTVSQLADIALAKNQYQHEVISIMRDTPEELIKERIGKRRVCRDCKATHTVDDGCCPKCGGVSEIRKDDAVIDIRLAEYQKNTQHIWIDLIGLSNAALTINGFDDANEVAKDVVKLVMPQ